MRLWHYEILKYLPRTQLLSQWRELNSIYVNQPNHILINYIYEYPKDYLQNYSQFVINEMVSRGYKISDNSKQNYRHYFHKNLSLTACAKDDIMFPQHDIEYLKICYYNLLEKYRRGQEDFEPEMYDKLFDFVLKASRNY